ncbi:MAG TPA: hypothetical protein VLT61_08400, partial [Anaeromyxobacteraceae bacterium]|nr:hypothetical protein [Anaeromyxobacteraceae bacterium]
AWPERMEGRRIEKSLANGPSDAPRRVSIRAERRGAEAWLTTMRPDPEREPAAERADESPERAEPPLVAGPDGRFARLEGLDALIEEEASFQVGLAASKAEAEDARRAAREKIGRLAAEAREQWSYQVEAWVGRSLELGTVVATTARVPVAAVPGLEVEQRVALSARKWVSCAPGGIDRRCLELTLKADAGPEAFRKGLAAAGGKAAKGFEDGSLVVEVVLVTDPETLLPWRYSFTRRLRLVFAGRGLSVDQVDRRELEYQWWKG